MRSRCFTIGACVLLTSLCGHYLHVYAQPRHSPPPDEYTYDRADVSVKGQILENPEYYDASVATKDGRRLLAWLEFIPGQGDYIWFGILTDNNWQIKSRLTHKPERQFANPTLTIDGAGKAWLSYEERRDADWNIYVRRWENGDDFSGARRVTPSDQQDIQHAAAAASQGGIHVVWQAERDGQFDIMACYVNADSQSECRLVSEGSIYSDWDPDIAVTATGTRYVVWDTFDGESHNVYSRIINDVEMSKIIPIGHTAAFEGKASVTAAGGDRVWILWEEGAKNWGRPFNDSQMPHTQSRGGLHRFRALRLAILDERGQVYEVKPQPPMPMFQQAVGRTAAPPGSERTGCYYERGALTADHQGRLWVVYRHFYAPRFLGARRFSEDNMGLMYGVFARYLDGDTWSNLYRLDTRQGDGDQRLDVAADEDGVALAWTVGRTHRNYRPLLRIPNDRNIAPYAPRGVALAELTAPRQQASGEVAAVPRAEQQRPSIAQAERPLPPPAIRVAGTQYRLVYGDLHRHTDLSRCYHMVDGSLTDAYRYALGPANLDFLSITDHACDLNWGNPASQVWWRSCKEVSRHLLEPQFVPFYAYEHSRNFGARGVRETDHNVITLQPDLLRPEFIPYPELTQELDNHAFLIPHAPLNANKHTIWDFHPSSHQRPLLEIYQGFRTSQTERNEQQAREGLRRGHRIGFIGSSDHQSTAASYACAWTTALDRESIFRALQSRRTFAATAPIQLAVLAGDHWMGEEFKATEIPEITLTVTGTAQVQHVDVILDGECVDRLPQKNRGVSLAWSPPAGLEGFHYIYVRVVQVDGQQAWSSPFFVHVRRSKP